MESQTHPLAQFNSLLQELTSSEVETTERTILIRYAPDHAVALRRDALTDSNKAQFVRLLKRLVPDLDQPHSYRTMVKCGGETFCTGIHLSLDQAKISIAIGRAFSLWNIFPVDNLDSDECGEMFRTDTNNTFPIMTGLGNFRPEYRGSLGVLH